MTRLRAALGVALVGGAVLTIPASDDFARADGPLGSNWVQQTAVALQIAFGEVESSSGSPDYACAGWNPATDTFSANQSTQVTLATAASDSVGEPTVRTSGRFDLGTYAGYTLSARGTFAGSTELTVTLANASTSLGTFPAVTWANGDTAKLAISGTTLTAYKNGVSFATVVDGTVATGQPGTCIYGATLTERIDNWTADNLGGGGPPPTTSGQFLLLGVGHP